MITIHDSEFIKAVSLSMVMFGMSSAATLFGGHSYHNLTSAPWSGDTFAVSASLLSDRGCKNTDFHEIVARRCLPGNAVTECSFRLRRPFLVW